MEEFKNMTIVVLGGGASGMMAALAAAESGEHDVILLERQARLGRKLLSTGNGRCNLTNLNAGPEHYHGKEAEFCRPALEKLGRCCRRHGSPDISPSGWRSQSG